jgi:hypothetical protein
MKGKPVLVVLFMIDLMVYMCKKMNYKLFDVYEMALLEPHENCKNKIGEFRFALVSFCWLFSILPPP